MATNIQWTDETWNPVTGCTKVSQGCKNCYAEKVFPRAYSKDQWPNGDGTFRPRRFTDVECHPARLAAPLSWKKPRRVFVNSMSDLFHEDVPFEFIDEVFAVMALRTRHTFQVLTKRPERMREYMSGDRTGVLEQAFETVANRHGDVAGSVAHENVQARGWPPPNVWLGVSVEDQATADERIPLLLETPAALRWVSYEPALGPVDFRCVKVGASRSLYRANALTGDGFDGRPLDWIVVGGESGPGARPFDIEWARSTVRQCKDAGVACFVKQLGARVTGQIEHPDNEGYGVVAARLNDRKGGDMDEWPKDLRVREWPR